jgi:eukaryotic-like serine/threonine-protein kinase
MPASETFLPPRYDRVRAVAHGGMGEIFLATDSELGRDVVIKVLAERWAGDEQLRARFRREALAAARLSGNPNIVTIFDVGEFGGRPAIVMEYLAGGSLEQRVDGRACRPAQVVEWLDEAAAALEAGIVHRDVKPGNLLLDGGGHIHVADFGIASAAGLDSFTQAGTVLGTSGYLSPEQARGERATPASDRYALAVVAYELLTGARPFHAESPTAEAAAHVNAPIPSAHGARPELPPAVDEVFRKALAKDPRARYGSAASFVAALRHALALGRGTRDEATTRIVHPPPPRPRRRRSALPLLAALALALLAVGIVAAYLATRDSSSTARGPVTVVHTITAPGTTVERTVTSRPQSTSTPTTTAATTTAGVTGASGAALNDAGYRKMQAGDFAGARPLLEEAVSRLDGTNSVTEAYADYNLAYTRLALGDCTGVTTLLDESQRIQGHRKEIDRLRHDAHKDCG